MRVDDKVRKTIVFIGVAGEGSFVAHGTGFVTGIWIEDKGFQTLVTARHVIDRIPSDLVHIRINTHDGRAQILTCPKSHWFSHPDKRVDVAVCPSVIPTDQFDILHIALDATDILTDAVIADRDFGIGDEVFIVGMFVGRLGQAKNIPILRTGTIAAMPEEKIETTYGYHHAYLIEARSIDGLSGSPVFIQTQPWRVKDGQPTMQHGHSHYLMGMVLGHNRVENAGDEIEILEKGPERPMTETVRVRTPLNTGIGVVIPISYIIEAVEQPLIQTKREAVAKEKDQRFKADSSAAVGRDAPTAEGAAGGDNPRHR